jgi:hypothetical protein
MDAKRKSEKQPVKRKTKHRGRYEVYTRPELYDVDRPGATWLVRIAIILTMVCMVAALHRPLLSALTDVLPSWHK